MMETDTSGSADPMEWSYTLKLSDAVDSGPHEIGSKAANLARLINAGFRIPDGFVLNTNAFHRFCEVNPAINSHRPDEKVAAEIPPEISTDLALISMLFGNRPLAVRSSAADEDLPDASYAGQYDTVLNVVGLLEVNRAVIKCWISAFNERVVTYRKHRGEDGVPPVAILIQPLIKADVAGVAFTANPVTGDRGETMVNGIRGLGERVVSGEATPDEWIVRDGSAEPINTPENVLTQNLVQEVATLAREVEAHYGMPQDIEWAMADGHLYLLQARPITTLSR
jgi:rifampicin phosphotransferase